MTFTLTIELGNDAMQSGADVVEAMDRLKRKIVNSDFARVDGGKIMDENGNSVGTWEVR